MKEKKAMENNMKYERQYFKAPEDCYDWVKKDYIEKPPIFCSVDLRDGNQALIEPMSLSEKIEFFKMLLKIGVKEIEVGFPAASDTEFTFLRTLIEEDMIPDDVTIQVLTQAREHIIRKTFEAVKGAKHAVIHLYNSTSVAQREQVFRKGKDEVKKIAIEGAKLLDTLAKEVEGNFTFQYSPESFPGTEIEYALEVCNAVLDVWKPTKEHKAIINIPTTVQIAMPHVFASQIEFFHKNMMYRDAVVLCVHPHNDRGSGISDAEMAVLAGADRVEGTLFGNGERTGNVDLVTLAMNMYTHGVDSGLDFSNIMEVREKYENLTGMKVPERSPYAGDLVFTAFSGSHQDAISKGMAWWDEGKSDGQWTVPYLPIDPRDLGRKYESDVIRINSQSGKGGVAYILKQNFGFTIPNQMKEEVGYLVKGISDKSHNEIQPAVVYQIFEDHYINNTTVYEITESHFRQENGIVAEITVQFGDEKRVVHASGNGRFDAVSNCIKQCFGINYEIDTYEEHALKQGSMSEAVAYVEVENNGGHFWGVGIDADIIKASIQALSSATNKMLAERKNGGAREQRAMEVMNYIQNNYQTVTLDDVSSAFFLSPQYMSKYIKEKTGKTFQENVKEIRMTKAKRLLKNTNNSVENIAEIVGYPNVEHFNRMFKKLFQMTPREYREK